MDQNEITGKINIKRVEISNERDPNKKMELQRELEILNLRKQIIFIQGKITQIKNSIK